MTILLESEFYVVQRMRDRIVRVTRKNRPFLSAADVDRACDPVQKTLDDLGRRRFGILIDTRAAVGRNDPSYEAMFERHRNRMVEEFAAVALMVGTPTGLLQVQRLLNQAGSTAKVFYEEALAITYLESKLGRPTVRP